MTFEEKMKEMLIECGMFDNQAEEVINIAKQDEANKAMSERWQDDIEGYPKPVLSLLWIATRRCALQWIDKNCPLAWYRPMFMPASS